MSIEVIKVDGSDKVNFVDNQFELRYQVYDNTAGINGAHFDHGHFNLKIPFNKIHSIHYVKLNLFQRISEGCDYILYFYQNENERVNVSTNIRNAASMLGKTLTDDSVRIYEFPRFHIKKDDFNNLIKRNFKMVKQDY